MREDIFANEIKNTIADSNIPWETLQGASLLITGATGLVGSNLIRIISAADKEYKLKMNIIGHGRNNAKGDVLADKYGITFIAGDIRLPLPVSKLPSRLDYIIHGAAITSSADMSAKPVDVLEMMIDGALGTLETAMETQCRKYIYLSSMEVYGKTGKKELREKDLGTLDLTNPRSSYPEGKRMCEMLCSAYASQYKLPVNIARLTRTFGPGFPNEIADPNDERDMRVAAQFVRKAAKGEDIELHTEGKSIANCCHTFDTVRALLTILLKGENGKIYNIASKSACASIRKMAETAAGVAKREGREIKVTAKIPKDIDERGYNADIGYTINADKLMKLGWSPRYNLEDMLTHTMHSYLCSDTNT